MTSSQEPKTENRRVLADLATNAELPSERLIPEARRADARKAVFSNSSGGTALSAGSKRTNTDANPTLKSEFPTEYGFSDSDDHSDADLEGAVIDQNCDQIRRKIRALIDSKEMKIGEFCEAIGVSNNSYNTFLRQNGPGKGMGSTTFQNAWVFFKKREMKGIPDPRNNKKRKTSAPQTDVSDVHLEGEETDSVEIYDTCDEVRTKINAHLKKDGVTQAQFLRDLAAQYHSKNQRIQSSQLAAFRSKKGPDAGNTSCVYYAAYCFFEKLRIKQGKQKSKTREKMEKIYSAKGGVDTTRPSHNRYFTVAAGEHIWQDKYGRIAVGSRSFEPI